MKFLRELPDAAYLFYSIHRKDDELNLFLNPNQGAENWIFEGYVEYEYLSDRKTERLDGPSYLAVFRYEVPITAPRYHNMLEFISYDPHIVYQAQQEYYEQILASKSFDFVSASVRIKEAEGAE